MAFTVTGLAKLYAYSFSEPDRVAVRIQLGLCLAQTWVSVPCPFDTFLFFRVKQILPSLLSFLSPHLLIKVKLIVLSSLFPCHVSLC